MADIILPKMGDAMEEGKIVQWLKSVGDPIKSGEAVAEIETDKSNVEIEADADGFLTAINADAGQTVAVGFVIGTIGAEKGAAAPAAPATPSAPAEAPKTEPVAAPADTTSLNGSGNVPKPEPEAAPAPAVAAPASYKVATAPTAFKPYNSYVGAVPDNLGGSASVIGEPVYVEATGGEAGGDVKASPLARAVARANNIDLATVTGSGDNGSIKRADVEAALANGGSAKPAAPAAKPATAPATAAPALAVNEGDTVVEYNAMRRTIAKRLTESKSTIPHFYVTSELDMEAFLSFREQLNASPAPGSGKISVTDLLTKAVAVALVENPVVNSAFSDNKRITRKAVNIGIAVSIEDGLIVPVVKNCENKSLRAIAKETRPLIEKARENKLKPEEYTGGTFTISNLGQYDVETFGAIINPGEGAILAVASVREVPAVVNGQIVPRKRMKVTLCADHRVMDGVAGAMFLQSLKRVIENPLQIVTG